MQLIFFEISSLSCHFEGRIKNPEGKEIMKEEATIVKAKRSLKSSGKKKSKNLNPSCRNETMKEDATMVQARHPPSGFPSLIIIGFG